MSRYQEASESALSTLKKARGFMVLPTDYLKRKPEIRKSNTYLKLEAYYAKGKEIEVVNPSGACWLYFKAMKAGERLVSENTKQVRDAANLDLNLALKNVHNARSKYKQLKIQRHSTKGTR